MADWSNLPKDLITKIAEHVELYEDFETFYWICSQWRSAAKEAKFRAHMNNNVGKSCLAHEHTLPLLLLPKKGGDSSNRRQLYSLSKRMVRHIDLPNSSYHGSNDNDNDNNKNRLLSSHGWLLVMLENKKFSLFNPFSGALIELPRIKQLPPVHQGIEYFHDIFVLSANPSSTRDFVVFLSLDHQPTCMPIMLVFWKNGDDGWIQVMDPILGPQLDITLHGFLIPPCHDITFYQGEFYGINMDGLVVKFETNRGNNTHFQELCDLSIERRIEYSTMQEWIDAHFNCNEDHDEVEVPFFYLVESQGKLLAICLVTLRNVVRRRSCTTHFEVFELDVKTGKVEEVQSLGNTSIFIGSNSSFSVEVNESHSVSHGFKPNCIYYTDDQDISPFATSANGFEAYVYDFKTEKFDSYYRGPSQLDDQVRTFIWVESPTSFDLI